MNSWILFIISFFLFLYKMFASNLPISSFFPGVFCMNYIFSIILSMRAIDKVSIYSSFVTPCIVFQLYCSFIKANYMYFKLLSWPLAVHFLFNLKI